MAKVNGVSGPIDTNDLGYTLMHEHILCADWSMRQAFQDWVDRDEFIDFAVKRMKRAKQRGVRTIVDATPVNLGRDIHVIREVAEKAEMQIIASTGFYWFEQPWLIEKDIDRLVERLIRDIEVGIQGTDSKAGIIKCASDYPGITDFNRKMLKVAARVHKATGVPITTHATVSNRIGAAQQDIFEEEGVDLSRVIIGHCGDTDDADYIESLVGRGSYVGMDRFGLDWIFPLEKRIDTLVEMIKRGHAGSMILSHDYSCFIDEKNNEWDEIRNRDIDEELFQYSYISDVVLPLLKEKGVADETIHQMLVNNPSLIFSRTTSQASA